LCGIRTRDSSLQAAKTHALEQAATVIDPVRLYLTNLACSEPAFKNRPKFLPKRNNDTDGNDEIMILLTAMLVMLIVIITKIIIVLID
jgi:hypothetical protein